MIEVEDCHATAVSKTSQFTLVRLLSKCMPFLRKLDKTRVTAVKLEYEETKFGLRGVSGDAGKVRAFINLYRYALHDILLKPDRKKAGQDLVNRRSSEEEDDEAWGSGSSAYHMNKVMSQTEYSLGRNIQQFVSEFESTDFSGVKLLSVMQRVTKVVSETVNAFQMQHNMGRSREAQKFCKPTVERYIFGKLYDRVFDLYKAKNAKADSDFRAVSDQIQLATP